MLFVPLPCSLVTEEAERIGLDNMARVSIAESGEGSLASQHLRTQHSAIKMLYERVKVSLMLVVIHSQCNLRAVMKMAVCWGAREKQVVMDLICA